MTRTVLRALRVAGAMLVAVAMVSLCLLLARPVLADGTTIQRLSPPDGATDVPVRATLAWAPVPDAEEYHVMVEEETAPGEFVAITPSVLATNDTSIRTPLLRSFGTYRWWVKPKIGGTWIYPDPITYWTFTTGRGGVIVYTTKRGSNDSISIMNIDGSNVTNLTDVGSNDGWSTISPKGDKIAFASARTGKYQIYTMNIDGTGLRQVTTDQTRDHIDPSFSVDGAKIAYAVGNDPINHPETEEIWIMDADGSGQQQLTTSGGGSFQPTFSHDGSRIVFVSTRNGNFEIYTMKADGSEQTRLTNHSARDSYPSYSPDDSTILFYSDRDGNREIYTMTTEGTGVTRITNNSSADDGPCYSPDGDKIIFASNRSGNRDIWIMNLDGSDPVKLTTNTGSDFDPGCAPGRIGNPPPDPPTPLTPGKGATAVAVPVTFRWTDVPAATSYVVEIGTDALFNQTVPGIPDTTGTGSAGLTVASLEMNKQYWWHVRAKNADGNSVWSETFSFTTEAERVVADLRAGLDTAATFGDNVYEKPVATQTLVGTTDPGQTLTYYLRLQNDGNTAKPMRLKRNATTATWSAKVFEDATSTEITAALLGNGTWTSPQSIAPGDSILFRVEVTPDAGAQPGESQTVSFFGFIQVGEVKDSPQDHVALTTQIALRKIDVEISPAGPTAYIGDDVYGTDGLDQLAAQMTAVGTAAEYLVRVTNEGNGPDGARVCIAPPPAGWTLQVLDAQDADITADFAEAKHVPLETGASAVLRVRLTPTNESAISPLGTRITATSAANANVADAVMASTTIRLPAVDLQARSTGSYVGAGVINATGVGQTVAATATPTAKAVYQVLLTNSGNATDTFLVKGPKSGAGWTIAYFSAATGGTDITGSITGSGWTSPEFQPGGTATLRVEVMPDNTVDGGTLLSSLITAAPAAAPAKIDAVRLNTTVQFARGVDLQITATGAYVGAGIVNGTGVNQTVTASTTVNAPLEYTILATNTGNAADRLILTLPAAPTGWAVIALDSRGTSITAAMQGAGYDVDLPRGGSATIRVRVAPGSTVIGGTTAALLVTGVSANDAQALDAVLASTLLPRIVRPDLQVRSTGSYIGDNVYNATAASQATSRTVASGTATFLVKLQNDGNAPDAITLKGSAGTPGWDVAYVDAATGGTPITGQVTGGGWTSPTLGPGEAIEVRVEVLPDAALNGGASCALLITGTSTFDGVTTDTVKATGTVATVRQPDLLVRAAGELADAGNDVYTSTAAGQTKLLSVARGATAQYVVTLQNDGNVTDSIRLTGTKGTTAWTVRYFDLANNGAEITASVTGTGFAVSLARGASRPVRVDVIPGSSAPLDTPFPVTVTAALASAAAVQDVGKLVTTRTIVRQMDMMVRNLSETAFGGDNVISATGEGQTRLQQIGTAGDPAIYLLRVQNDSDGVETLVVRQDPTSVVPAGWTVRYYDSPTGGYDITSLVTSSTGWLLASRQPGSIRDIRVEMKPALGVPFDSQASVLVATSSYSDPSKVDAALCIARKVPVSSVTLSATPATGVTVGAPVKFSATSVGGNSIYYCFRVRYKDPVTGGQVWLNGYTRDFSPQSTVTWTFSEPRTYTIVVYACEKGTGGAAKYDVTDKLVNFTVAP